MLDHGVHLAESSLGREVVEYMIDHDSHMFMSIIQWAESICNWNLAFLLIISTILLYMVMIIRIWEYQLRPRHPPHMDTRLSHAESVFPDELDKEFDSFPKSQSAEIVRMRYDRLQSVAGRIQTVVGDMVS